MLLTLFFRVIGMKIIIVTIIAIISHGILRKPCWKPKIKVYGIVNKYKKNVVAKKFCFYIIDGNGCIFVGK